MSTVGSILRQAREAKGLTISELAVRTRIKSQQIEGLERDDFSVSPAPMYTKGFLKICAQELDLDLQSLMEIFAEQTASAKPKAAVLKPGAVKAPPLRGPVPPPADPAGNPLAPAEEPPIPKRIPVRASLRPAGTGMPLPKREFPDVFGGLKSLLGRIRLPALPAVRLPTTSVDALKPLLPKLGISAAALLLLFLLIRGCQAMSGGSELPPLREPMLLEPMPLRLPLPANTP